MIARRWSGRVPVRNAAGFEAHLLATGVADYRAQPDCVNVMLLRSTEGDWAVFELTSVWTDMGAIQAYAGPDADRAVLYPGDEVFGLVPELQARHFELVALP